MLDAGSGEWGCWVFGDGLDLGCTLSSRFPLFRPFYCKDTFPFVRMNREETRTSTVPLGSFNASYRTECSSACRASKDGQTFSFSDQKDELSGWGPPETWRENTQSAGCCLLSCWQGQFSCLNP